MLLANNGISRVFFSAIIYWINDLTSLGRLFFFWGVSFSFWRNDQFASVGGWGGKTYKRVNGIAEEFKPDFWSCQYFAGMVSDAAELVCLIFLLRELYWWILPIISDPSTVSMVGTEARSWFLLTILIFSFLSLLLAFLALLADFINLFLWGKLNAPCHLVCLTWIV